MSSGRPILRDVTLRDGLQLVRTVLPMPERVKLVRTLLRIGVPSIEVAAMVRPERVPQLADSVQVLAHLDVDERAAAWVWVPNSRGVELAVAAGARHLQYVLSVSEAHNLANVGRTREASLDDLPQAIALAHAGGAQIQIGLATAFGCPFAGTTPPDEVRRIIDDDRTRGADSWVLCDTIGVATASQVASLVAETRAARPRDWLIFHGHDTWGQGVANSLAALDAGADTVDGSLGGLGGCPFAPGASGNTATEDLLYALRPPWLTTDAFRCLVSASNRLTSLLGEPQRSRAAEGSSKSPPSNLWATQNESTGAGTRDLR